MIEKFKKTSLYIFFGLLAYIPLHIFLSTWLGTTFGILELAKIFKDIVLFAGFLMIFAASVRTEWFTDFLKEKLTLVIATYAVITILLALIRPTDQDAEILGVVYNLRFLLFFLYGSLLARHYKPDWLRSNALRVVVVVALPVIVFGVVQYLWLPTNALSSVGYSRENGVLPAFFIDDKPDLERSMSTLRDPNSLGSYLLIILAITAVYFLRTRNKDLKQTLAGFSALALLCLYFTFSRGAWIGALMMLTALPVILYVEGKKRIRIGKWPLVIAGTVLILGGGMLYGMRDTYFVQNVVFHADESTTLEDPNELRLRFWRESLESAVENPLGTGPGTAGLASIKNDKQGVVLNENYYLQVLQEVGIFGLITFVAILVFVFLQIYRNKTKTLALALLVSFVGLMVTNLFVHIWSNETIALTWWGLAGLVLFRDAGNSRRPRVRKNNVNISS